jgi:hypothetical protein
MRSSPVQASATSYGHYPNNIAGPGPTPPA